MYLFSDLRLNVTSLGTFSVVWLIFKIWLEYGACGCKLRTITSIPKTEYSQSGTLSIGIIMPVHVYEPGTKCSQRLKDLGSLQLMESMVFAINEINTNKMVHPNVTLGFTIVDDCSNDITAFSKALTFFENVHTCSRNDQSSVVAMIAGEGTGKTKKIADLLSLIQVPLISFSATSSHLDDTMKFPYFFRIVPSLDLQAQAIVDILRKFQWSYVSILYRDNFYGQALYEGVKERMNRLGYCIAVEQNIRKEFDEIDYANIAKKLSEDPRAHVVIVALTIFHAKIMFETFAKNWKNNFTWIVTESVGEQLPALRASKHVISGMLALRFQCAPVERFHKYFKSLTFRNGSRNPWFRKFFKKAFNCRVEGNNSCDLDVAITNSVYYEPDCRVSLSMDAVYLFAHALKAVLDKCSHTTLLRECVDGKRLRDAIRKVNFRGEHVHIRFNNNGSALSNYEINNVYVKDRRLIINTVGVWNSFSENFTYFHKEQIKWNSELNSQDVRNQTRKEKVPISTCGIPCPPGYGQMITEQCCWDCKSCNENERTVLDKTVHVCSVCPNNDNFTWPDESTRTKCLPIQSTFNGLSQKIEVSLFALNILVLLSAITISTLYVINRNNRLIKASSREISQMMLGGHMIVCLLAITQFLKPLEATCALFQIYFPFSFSITYGSLLVKTNRIYRIFIRKKMTTKKPRFTSPRAQIVMVTVIIAIQILLSGMGLFMQPPKVVLMMPSIHTKYVENVCESNIKGVVVALTYCLCLAIGCTVHAYKVRNLPSNFNEAKFIVISLYCIALLWIGIIPGYFTADTEIVKKRCLVVFMLLNMFAAQLFLLYPKLFAIYCLNTSTLSTTSRMFSTGKSAHSLMT